MTGLMAALLVVAQSNDSLMQQIERRIAADSGAYVGVAYVDLGSSDTLFLNADSSFHAASTMKVPVMIELFRRAGTGSFRMDQGLLVVNQFASLVDGSPFTLDPASDSDSSLY
ncbi:MAG TPA: serine hydrolase, partial [Gemmatimonadaceae bacterium]|nr:serine hydrolase [Gemmatimonadaceae bacterium]